MSFIASPWDLCLGKFPHPTTCDDAGTKRQIIITDLPLLGMFKVEFPGSVFGFGYFQDNRDPRLITVDIFEFQGSNMYHYVGRVTFDDGNPDPLRRQTTMQGLRTLLGPDGLRVAGAIDEDWTSNRPVA